MNPRFGKPDRRQIIGSRGFGGDDPGVGIGYGLLRRPHCCVVCAALIGRKLGKSEDKVCAVGRVDILYERGQVGLVCSSIS